MSRIVPSFLRNYQGPVPDPPKPTKDELPAPATKSVAPQRTLADELRELKSAFIDSDDTDDEEEAEIDSQRNRRLKMEERNRTVKSALDPLVVDPAPSKQAGASKWDVSTLSKPLSPSRPALNPQTLSSPPGKTNVPLLGKTDISLPSKSVLLQPGRANVPLPSKSVLLQPGRTNVPPPGKTDAPLPSKSVLLQPGRTNVPPPGKTDAPLPSKSVLLQPDRTNVPPPGKTDAPLPSKSVLLQPDRTNVPPPGKTDAPLPSKNVLLPSQKPDVTPRYRIDIPLLGRTDGRPLRKPDTLQPRRTDTPAQRRTDTPAQRRTDTPAQRRTDTPAQRRTNTPPQRRTNTPPQRRTNTPPQRRTNTPPQHKTHTPPKRRTDTPPLQKMDEREEETIVITPPPLSDGIFDTISREYGWTWLWWILVPLIFAAVSYGRYKFWKDRPELVIESTTTQELSKADTGEENANVIVEISSTINDVAKIIVDEEDTLEILGDSPFNQAVLPIEELRTQVLEGKGKGHVTIFRKIDRFVARNRKVDHDWRSFLQQQIEATAELAGIFEGYAKNAGSDGNHTNWIEAARNITLEDFSEIPRKIRIEGELLLCQILVKDIGSRCPSGTNLIEMFHDLTKPLNQPPFKIQRTVFDTYSAKMTNLAKVIKSILNRWEKANKTIKAAKLKYNAEFEIGTAERVVEELKATSETLAEAMKSRLVYRQTSPAFPAAIKTLAEKKAWIKAFQP